MDQHLALPLMLVAGAVPQLIWWGGRCLFRSPWPFLRWTAMAGGLLGLIAAALQQNILLSVGQLLLLFMLADSGRNKN
jgi:hypothetical protein